MSHARPWSSNGYAVRTHAMARALAAAGREVIVFTRPGRPWDIEGFSSSTQVDIERRIDGIRYVCLPLRAIPGAKPSARLRAMSDVLTEAFYAFRPAAVLAASNWETAEPARRAAGRMGATFFYEQRGFWEMGEAHGNADDAARLETEIALAARAVFTLNGPMRDELVRRGIPKGRVHLVPNGLSSPGRIDSTLGRASIGCHSAHLLGYIGSLSAYEGVETLVDLVALLRRGGPALQALDVDALVVGSDAPKGLIGTGPGPAEKALRARAARLGIADHVHFVPQQPEDVIGSYYVLCDALVMPRRRTPVTELVPPIKPYTAASYGLPVFMTDLPPLAEIAAEIRGTLFPEGDVPALATLVHRALTEGQPLAMPGPGSGLTWADRLRPVLRHLEDVAEAERSRNERMFAGLAMSASASGEASMPSPLQDRFDLGILPAVGLRGQLGGVTEARIGPERKVEMASVTRLTRSNLLDVLATAEPGRFVIDWAGLKSAKGHEADEWAGLWSIDDMRLNRQIMDAVRIAMSRGWRLQVIGPVHRSEAPLFRTVANVMEEVLPEVPLPAVVSESLS
ncbi:glycosyltransferase [Rhodobacter sp. ETT8]|uniref:Glycosyltransferase n=1 Tax=Pseudotabrizicola algicola TaxID=2709381 RepID=A0A6B3RN33_9RHOB|nr:glycosyltransferase [Pseudotabrizicola algicola]